MDGISGGILGATAGYINVGARWPDGTYRGPSDGIFGKAFANQFFNLNWLCTICAKCKSANGRIRSVS